MTARARRQMKSKARRLPPPLESDMQKTAVAMLERLDWHVCVRKVGAVQIATRFIRFEQPGRSDLYGTVGRGDGRHFEIESKRLGKKPSSIQIKWLKDHNNAHNVAFWYDNLETLYRVALWVQGGGSIEFTGYGADFDLVK
jgi:hypothetical protein